MEIYKETKLLMLLELGQEQSHQENMVETVILKTYQLDLEFISLFIYLELIYLWVIFIFLKGMERFHFVELLKWQDGLI